MASGCSCCCRVWFFWTATLCVTLASIASIGGLAAYGAVDEAAAMGAAGQLATAVGVPFGDGATAALDGQAHGPARGAQWTVEYGRFSRFHVDGDTGRVAGFVDFSALKESYLSVGKSVLPESQAVDIASATLRIMGMSEDLVFDRAVQSNPGDNISEWVVTWKRVWNGIRYGGADEPGAAVTLDGVTGRVIIAAIYEPPAAPSSAEVRVTEREALAIGEQVVKGKAPHWSDLSAEAELAIVQANNYWSEAGMVEPAFDDPARVAWVVKLTREERDSAPPFKALVWVDAEDGTVLGGASSGGGAAAAGAPVLSGSSTGVPISVLVAAFLGIGLILAGLVVRRGRRTAPA